MNTCKDCKWWAAKAHTWIAGGTKREVYVDDYRQCGNPKLDVRSWFRRLEDSPSVFLDGAAFGARDGRGGYFITGPDFGCIHWEQK